MPCSVLGVYHDSDRNFDSRIKIRQMIKHYVKTWCVPDVLLVTCDWVVLTFELQYRDATNARDYLKFGALLRLLRFMRLLRLVKIDNFFYKVLEWVQSEYV